MTKLEPYFSDYNCVTDILPDWIVDRVFAVRDSTRYDAFDVATPGEQDFKCVWHIQMDALVTYELGRDFDGEYVEYLEPAVKVTFWPAPKADLTEELPNLEPILVVITEPRWDDLDDDEYSAFVRADFLATEEGKQIGRSLMHAQLALSDDDED